MDTLQEIVLLLDRYKVRQIEVLTNASDGKENRYFECYSGMRDGRWSSDDEMAEFFGFEPGSKAFTRFRNEVKKRLQNSLLFIDTSLPEFNDYNRAAITLTQQWAIAKVLMHRGARKAFVEMAEQILKVAIYFEFLDIIVEVLQSLISSIMPFPQYNKDFPRYMKMYEEYKDALDAEKEVWKTVNTVMWPLVTQKGVPAHHLEPIVQATERLRPLAEKYSYIILQSNFRNLELFSYIFNKDWEKVLVLSRDAKNFLEAKPANPVFHILKFAQQEAASLVMLARFDEARTLCRESMSLLTEGISMWFKFWEMETVAAFQAGCYEDAWHAVKQAMKHRRFETISAMDQESWRVFYGYLCLMSRLQILPLSSREKGEAEKFRLSSWLNDLPLHSQDKRGANIPVLILQTLFLLTEKRYDEFENRTEALRKYRQRNLEADSQHVRTDCFIRLMESIPKNGYQLKRISQEAEKWLEKMQMSTTNILDYSYELEIVPYERQWEWTIDVLKCVK
ncbi:MAG: hypothetical protein LCH81_06420 [Bacteroidetes bacterium]|nr:hypothetical protein [Bacteroidota bacterium]